MANLYANSHWVGDSTEAGFIPIERKRPGNPDFSSRGNAKNSKKQKIREKRRSARSVPDFN